ncbi:MAG: glycosyltransferase, partial [Planctomycetota bacterium]
MASVTVLMSVYNGMPYLPEAVDSILNQTYQDWQFVIVNDGSQDESRDYRASLTDQRIRIVDQENQGLAASLNHGLKFCETPYVARMDSDDIALPKRLELQMKFLAENSEIGMLGGQFLRMGQKSSGFASKLPTNHPLIHSSLLQGKHAVCHPTIVCKTEIMKSVGGYWKHPVAQDWDLYLKMCENTIVANLESVVLKYR